MGYRAGSQWGNGSQNIAIGAAGTSTDGATTRIGTMGLQKRAFVAGIRDVSVTGGQAVLVDKAGQLGVVLSSSRYKRDLQPMGEASSAILQVHPVTFRYKEADGEGRQPLQYGLVAEDVAAVLPALAIYNDAGEPESVAYHMLPSLLLNELQKQSRKLAAAEAKVETLEAEMAELRRLVGRLTATAATGQLAARVN